MGQNEIIDFLRAKRLGGDESYFTTHEIMKGCNGGAAHYSAVKRSLYNLVKMKIVDSHSEGDIFEWVRAFRISDKHLKERGESDE